MTPLPLTLQRCSTRRNSKGLIQFILEPEHVYHRRKRKLASRKILEDLRSESIFDIHLLFVDNPQSSNPSTSMANLFKPLDFSAIVGYPHQIHDKSIEKVPSFYGNYSITAKSHLFSFTQCYNKWWHNVNYEDVKMMLFTLSLEADAFEWFTNLDDNGIKTFTQFENTFEFKMG